MEDDSVRVQPGVVLAKLNRELSKQKRRIGPKPSSAETCTLGGMLATNASGGNALRHGYIAEHVRGLRVMLADGRIESTGTYRSDETVSPFAAEIESLLNQHRETIRNSRRETPFNRCGYRLRETLRTRPFDLTPLLIGSEGTLGFILEASLQTIPPPFGRGAALFVFTSLEAALKAVQLARGSSLVECELMDRRLISLARTVSDSVNRQVPLSAEAVLLVETETETPEQSRLLVQELVEKIHRKAQLSLVASPAFDALNIAKFESIRAAVLPGLYGVGVGPRPLAIIEDLGVHPDRLAEFVGELQRLFRQREVSASLLMHAATGQIHARPFLDLSVESDREKLWPLADAVHQLAIDFGGTISSQHGTGIARTPWVEKQVGPLMPIYRDVKRLFDPQNLLNPGKLVNLDPSRPAWPLRVPLNGQPSGQRILNWGEHEFEREISSCNGCGDCRTQAPTQRMCPLFRISHHEAATPRAKANLLREMLQVPDQPLASVRAVTDQCVNCKMCASECDAGVNIPRLMLETKAVLHAQQGLRRADWFAARLDGLSRWGSNLPVILNFLLSRKGIRWSMEKLFGLSRHRRLPAFARRNFIKVARRRGWTQKHPSSESKPIKVAYFVDTFAAFHDISIAEATVRVLKHQGIEVLVPEKQRGCGMAALAMGDVERAREAAWQHLRLFGDLIRDGYEIVCSEPTAAVLFREDLPHLIEDVDVPLIREKTHELTGFLWQFHQRMRMRSGFQKLPLSVGHHVPCHLKALGLGVHSPSLLRLIPDFRVEMIDLSCSGMAGTFGLPARQFHTSLQAGEPMLKELARPRYLFGSTECSTCRMQMEQGTNKRTLHPIQYLALGYGLMPELADKLKQPLKPLVSG
jgi:FAD/FMN-containing dehydrogenase/Fe-S oxidoreductase